MRLISLASFAALISKFKHVALILVVGLLGCSSLPPLSNLDQYPPQMELEQVPFFPQRQQQCGAAALATVLAHRQVPVTAKQLEDYLYIPGREGSLSIDIIAQARQHGMLAYPLNDFDALLQEVTAGNPVLVLQNLGLSWLPQWHFAVVVGYDLTDRNLVLRSGYQARRIVPIEAFRNTWSRAGKWATVILPPDKVPVSAQAIPYLKAAHDLDQVGKKHEASVAYESALMHWPDSVRVNQVSRLALSNIAYQRGEMQTAKTWLLELLELYPDMADSWNNLGYVSLELGCRNQALAAVQCAVRLSPDDQNFSASLHEIENSPLASERLNNDQYQCSVPACPLGL